METDKHSTTKFKQLFIKGPIRVLSRARDVYVKSLNDVAGNVNCSPTTLPRSFSIHASRASHDEDFQALIRAISQGDHGGENETPIHQGLRRSFTVGMSRINEDEPCDFEDDYEVNLDKNMLSRTRSVALTKRKSEGAIVN